MRKFGIAALAAVALMFSPPATADPSIVEQDTVHQVLIGAPDAPVKVLFGRHAAIYLLDRNDPNFAAWLAILQQAHDQGSQVRFAYDVYGPRLTRIEPAP
ncbi:hypothetical protein BST27_26350 [Mycobacterium intermedium]|uniref:Uncharacterized protein n=1 Tax=Mycobacterium intermedium TaxID=28445 RepID=A0A1E3SCC6_MYCIE|nr:hypothetical protein [Mycobacterium intermedium]MCV6962470.1 hypothetical protein [Mycobacterium intermedium]ODQ99744.1 hypothetical protein BHQ20_15710 [Mycobacterium intermedium]OPE46195.1 hypothetical protein BV508_26900 [Mycobacterium intermedium]ORA95722.1 hypothetical protein BST27_26350 [Mycobacterium intermedium]